jgi:hypothetical protein
MREWSCLDGAFHDGVLSDGVNGFDDEMNGSGIRRDFMHSKE